MRSLLVITTPDLQFESERAEFFEENPRSEIIGKLDRIILGCIHKLRIDLQYNLKAILCLAERRKI
jgi:hypothetical protein